jgi:alpha-L-fucosidase
VHPRRGRSTWHALAFALAAMLVPHPGAGEPADTPFQPTPESLARHGCPDWFRDAKFGIWAHWGPQSVPMMGDWYARKMYEPATRGGVHAHHVATYGHPSRFGYKDILPLWKAEQLEPDRLMARFKAAGARYFVALAVHHDNFDLWDSRHHRWNAVQVGPKRDIVGAWREAAVRHGLRFGVSEHLAASFTWFQSAHGLDPAGPLAGVPYDGADPRWQDLYHPPAQPGDHAWYSTNPDWARQWQARITDLVDRYQPDLLYSDGGFAFGEVGLSLVAHFFNGNRRRHAGRCEAVYNVKDLRHKPGHGDFHEGVGVQDMERGRMPDIHPRPWQTDTSIGDWFYNRNWRAKDTGTPYRSALWVVQTLADVVSKNGNMLLNVVLRPDGSLDPEAERLLDDVGAWLHTNGEAIYGTRPWLVYGEGPNRTTAESIRLKYEDFRFGAEDIRFTRAADGSAVYAIVLDGAGSDEATVKALAADPAGSGNRITGVRVLGAPGPARYTQTNRGLAVQLPPSSLPGRARVIKVTGENLRPRTRP